MKMKSSSIVSAKATTLFDWLDWIILDFLLFVTVQINRRRIYSKLSDLGRKTFVKYNEKLQLKNKLVEETVAQEIPKKFGLIINGWTESDTSTH